LANYWNKSDFVSEAAPKARILSLSEVEKHCNKSMTWP